MKENAQFRASWTKVFIAKLWLPFLVLIGEATVLRGGQHVVELAFLPTLGALFYLSAVQVRPEERVLRYRYFYLLPWLRIPYDEIVDCKVSIAPGLGVLKLRRFVPPWGKIYFVLEGPNLEVARRGGQSSLTSIINAHRQHKRFDSQADGNNSKGGLALFVAAVAIGGAFFFFTSIWRSNFAPFDPAWFPQLAFYMHFQGVILTWPWNLILGLALTTIIFQLRFDKKTLPLAVSLGGLLGALAARIFL